MRISTSMLYDGLTDRLASNAADMAELQSQISTGRKYANASEAPDIVGHVQAIESRLKTLDADAKAVSQVKVGVEAQSRALYVATGVIDRLKEIAFQGGNDPQPQAVLDQLAEEVASIKRSLIDIANTRDASDRFVFGGARSGEIPYVLNPDGTVDYSGATSPLRVRTTDASYEDAAVPGTQVWKAIRRGPNTVDMFQALTDFESALRTGSLGERTQALQDANAIAENLGVAVARTGAAEQRLNITESQAQETSIRAQAALGELRDLDIASALAQLQKQELLMQASQSLLGRLSKLSLLQYIQ
jgi:flagellar hook-associated protein 3 FlgL